MAKNDLTSYFQNPEALDRALSVGAILFDYAFYHNYFKGSIFELFLYRVLEIYHLAKEQNAGACFEILGLWQPAMAKAHQNVACVAHLERPKTIGRLDLFAKTCFQELADMIEGTIGPHLKLLNGMSRISRAASSPKQIVDELRRMSLGDAVAGLVNMNEDFGIIYRDVLHRVPLNQWRNIANHAAYCVVADEMIECHYGKNNELTVTLDRSGMAQLYTGVHHVGYMHKMAHNFIFCDNIEGLKPFLPDNSLADDTITIQIVESCYLHGYEVVACGKSSEIWMVTIRDQLGRGVVKLKSSCELVMDLLAGITGRQLAINVLASDGRVVIRGETVCR